MVQMVKNLPAMQETWARSLGSIPGSERFSGEREWLPAPVILPGKFHGQRSLVGCSLWSRKESDMTEWLTVSLSADFGPFCPLLPVHNQS